MLLALVFKKNLNWSERKRFKIENTNSDEKNVSQILFGKLNYLVVLFDWLQLTHNFYYFEQLERLKFRKDLLHVQYSAHLIFNCRAVVFSLSAGTFSHGFWRHRYLYGFIEELRSWQLEMVLSILWSLI